MDLNPKQRLMFENQLVLLGAMAWLTQGLADRGMLQDNALQKGRIESQIAKTRTALEAEAKAEEHRAELYRACPYRGRCLKGFRDCECASVGR